MCTEWYSVYVMCVDVSLLVEQKMNKHNFQFVLDYLKVEYEY
jgi:hypothetical protein